MSTAALAKLRDLLNELFLLDDPELDFGLYRVMNARRREVEHFRDHELASAVTRALTDLQNLDRAALEKELAQVRAELQKFGVKEEASERVSELKAQIALAENVTHVSDEVFAHLFAFFSRYYQAGDFHCRRQFRDGVYAIPYEGEEVRLFWANADQYYIKTTQRHTTYEFTLPGEGRRVRFEVVGGVEERDNTRSERVFQLAEVPFAVSGHELTVRFVHAPDAAKRPQDEHHQRVAEALKARADLAEWAVPLLASDGDGPSTRLAKRLRHFTRRETFDYFIHKDLGGFLRQELDYYLKTEVMRLDDIAHATAPRAEEYLSKLKITRSLGRTIIDFIAQLEDFQKRLWLKKKFVLDAHWLVSVGMVPRALWPEVIANDRQREAWVRLCAIDKIPNDLADEGYTVPLRERFLERFPTLPLDTSLFDADFTARLLESLGDLDAKSLGLLIHGENFQALQLLHERYREKIDCVFIDPPYNTGGDGFAYKDNYPHSSWLAMMENRLGVTAPLLSREGALFATISDEEQPRLRILANRVFGEANTVANVIWQKKYSPANDAQWFSDDHDHVLVIARDREVWRPTKLPRSEKQNQGYTNPDNDPRGPWMSDNYTSNKTAEERPNLYYAIIHPKTGEEIWPSKKAVWRYDQKQHALNIAENRIWWGVNGDARTPRYKRFLSEVGDVVPRTIWSYEDAGHNQDAVRWLQSLFVENPFTGPKPVELIERVLHIAGGKNVLDFFGGSGTTAHAALNTRRPFILVEAAEHFDTVLKPRVAKVMHAREWKDGVPVKREGTQGVVQVLRLESYDDTLDNLESQLDDAKQRNLFDANVAPTAFGRDYLLKYMLQHSTRGSPSLLDARALEHPFDRKLRVTLNGTVQTVTVDVPETFHWLLGMTVTHRERCSAPALWVSWGALHDGRRVVTVWRDVDAVPLAALETWFCEKLLGRLGGVELVYVNGDENLERFRSPEHAWRVRRSEHEFIERMFSVGA